MMGLPLSVRENLRPPPFPPIGGRGIPSYLSHFVIIFSNLYHDWGVKWPFLGMLTELSRCKKLFDQKAENSNFYKA